MPVQRTVVFHDTSSQPVSSHSCSHLAVVLLQHANRCAHLFSQGVHVHLPIHQAHGGLIKTQPRFFVRAFKQRVDDQVGKPSVRCRIAAVGNSLPNSHFESLVTNSPFKQALQPLESGFPRRLASGPEIDRLLRRFDTVQATCCTQLSRNHVRLPCNKSMFISAVKLLA